MPAVISCRQSNKHKSINHEVMKIEIKTLTLINFKGIKHKVISLNSDINSIVGDNGTGKTTIKDAFLWLLFGKDSNDRTDFEIKPLDMFGNPSQKIENEVSAELIIDGISNSVKRVFREK